MENTPIFDKKPLISSKYAKLPLRSIEPLGWYKDQLKIQASGLTGTLEDFWQYVGIYSNWKNGTETPTEWVPNYVDGLLPLAYLLKDDKLKTRALVWIENVLNSQEEDGNFGYFKIFDPTQYWFQLAMLKVIVQYYEIEDDERVIPFLLKYFIYLDKKLDTVPLVSWSRARGGDIIYTIHWLYNRTEDKSLLSLAEKVYRQSLDWEGFCNEFPFTRPMGYYFNWDFIHNHLNPTELFTDKYVPFHITHGVNIAQGLKTPGLFYRQSKNPKDYSAIKNGLDSLDKYHGQVTGMYTCDEHLNGKNPNQGTELCAVSEIMFTLEALLEVYPDEIMLYDRLEKIAYNALPGTITEDFTAHQYDQQANQILSTRGKRNWYNNNDDSNLFGLEPNFVCCTANMHQGWPKLSYSFFMAKEDGGISTGVYAPCRADFTTAKGTHVVIDEDTEYPFHEDIRFTFHLDKKDTFEFKLRIPKWCTDSKLLINDEECETREKGFYIIHRTWGDGDTILLKLPMSVRVFHRYHNAISVERGPIIYSLEIKEDWRKLQDHGLFGDWEIYPDSAWNYAIMLDEDNLGKYFIVEKKEMSKQPFSHQPPIVIHCKGKKLPEWKMENNSAGCLPVSPVHSEEPAEDLILIPYGGAKLRVSEMPYIDTRSL